LRGACRTIPRVRCARAKPAPARRASPASPGCATHAPRPRCPTRSLPSAPRAAHEVVAAPRESRLVDEQDRRIELAQAGEALLGRIEVRDDDGGVVGT